MLDINLSAAAAAAHQHHKKEEYTTNTFSYVCECFDNIYYTHRLGTKALNNFQMLIAICLDTFSCENCSTYTAIYTLIIYSIVR